MKKYIIFVIIISIAYLMYIFKNEILWFLNAIKVTVLNKKAITDLQKKGMKNRNLKNDEIKKYIELSKKYLKKLNIDDSEKFVLDEELERHLRYSRFSEKYIKELFFDILSHMNLSVEEIELKINYVSSKYKIKNLGIYEKTNVNSNRATITINIQNDMTIENIISILAHESTHHLLLSNNIRLENITREEILTDVTAAILGFGKIMIKGHEISNRVTYDSEFKRYVNKNSIGYLTSNDIKCVIKNMNKIDA